MDITQGPMEVGPTMHYMMGGVRVDAETGATTRAGPLRRRRGRRRHARRQPAGRQLALGPARVRPPRGRGGRRGRAGPARPARPSRQAQRGEAVAELEAPFAAHVAARTRTASTRSSRRRCSRWWASSGPRRTWTRRSRASASCSSAGETSGSTGRASSTRLGPRLRAAQHAHRVRGGHPRGAPAHREPRAPTAGSTIPATDPAWEHLNVVVRRRWPARWRSDGADRDAGGRPAGAARDGEGIGAS